MDRVKFVKERILFGPFLNTLTYPFGFQIDVISVVSRILFAHAVFCKPNIERQPGVWGKATKEKFHYFYFETFLKHT